MVNLIVAFRNFANAPKSRMSAYSNLKVCFCFSRVTIGRFMFGAIVERSLCCKFGNVCIALLVFFLSVSGTAQRGPGPLHSRAF